MLTSVVAVVALVVLVLPGFVCSRVAAGRRAQPTSITDLELVLRSLGYTLLIHGLYVASGWTPGLADRFMDAGDGWGDLRLELIGFTAAVLATAAIIGYWIGELLRWLERLGTTHPKDSRGRVAFAAFHALGGQDARDAFDYVLERRRNRDKTFIVVLRVDPAGADDDGLRVGLFGPQSYSGASPRPHDVHLEEVWKFVGKGHLKRVTPPHEAWYKPDQIKDIWFREIKPDEVEQGEVRDFARGGLREALQRHRGAYAAEVVAEAQKVEASLDDAKTLGQRARDRFRGLGSDPSYEDMVSLRPDVMHAAAWAFAASGQAKAADVASQESVMRVRIETSRHNKYDWQLWERILDYYVELPKHKLEWEAEDLAAHLAIGAMWIDDLDPADWEEHAGKSDD